ncbi:Uncharacterised protein [Nocardia farcinica]|nr:Uncharacterised protein [Nocardia farcinica]
MYALGDYTDKDTAGDPDLTRRLLTHIGYQIGRAAISTGVDANAG